MLAISSTLTRPIFGYILEYHLGQHINSLKPTNGLQEKPMDKPFKYNSRQWLVHRDCHQLPKPNMGAPHVLSISPILVIDDNHFQESLLKELTTTMQCNNT
jgi:hypothetical protein